MKMCMIFEDARCIYIYRGDNDENYFSFFILGNTSEKRGPDSRSQEADFTDRTLALGK